MRLLVVLSPMGSAREPTADDRVRRVAGPVRVAVALALVAAAPLADGLPDGDVARFVLLVGLGWLPAAAVVSTWARRRPSTVADVIALVVDLVLLVLVQVFVHPDSIVVFAGLVVLVAAATYCGGRRLGIAGAFAGMGVAAAGDHVDALTVVVFPALLAVVAGLLETVATERWRARMGLLRLDERSEAILTGIGEAVIVTDGRGRIDQWNRAATATFDCDAHAAKGRDCHEVLGLHHEVRSLDCSAGCPLLEQQDAEVWRRSPTGARQPLLASASPVVDDRGEVVEVVHSFRDITRLKQADEAKTLFLATASHELKTPLTVIRGFSQMLLLPDAVLGDDERRAALRAIDNRARQLTEIVDRLLMSSRIDAGRIDLELVAVALGSILEERANALEGATGREVVLTVDRDLPDAWCDADACTTVVDHLLDNAVKYSPNGGPIDLAARGLPSGVELVVADEGIGMTPEQAAQCFERFWQAEATDVRRFGGTGIGLYIVRSLVHGMGATITVDSDPGRGSRFRVVLRRADLVGEVGDDGGGDRLRDWGPTPEPADPPATVAQ